MINFSDNSNQILVEKTLAMTEFEIVKTIFYFVFGSVALALTIQFVANVSRNMSQTGAGVTQELGKIIRDVKNGFTTNKNQEK